MAYSLLLCVKKPENDENDFYSNFVKTCEGIYKQNRGLQILNESSLLIPLNDTLQVLTDVLKAIKDLSYTYTMLNEDNKLSVGKGEV